MKRYTCSGFTLLEVTFVLVILGLLIGGLMRPLLNSREQLMQSRADLQLTNARNALLGFAARNGRLPCPASADSAGTETLNEIGCDIYQGFLPVVSLGLAGPLDAQILLLDPWSKRIDYSVSSSDSDSNGMADFPTSGGMREAGLSRLQGDLKVFHWLGKDCSDLQLRASHVVAVIYSDGKNTNASNAEQLNRSNSGSYATGAYSQSTDCGYDDHVQWLSDSALFTQMLRAQQLP